MYSDIDKNKTEVHLEIWIGNDNKTATVNPEFGYENNNFKMSIKAKMEVESQNRQKSLAVLVDPDKLSSGNKTPC